MKMLQSLYPTREFDLDVYWVFFQDLSNGELFCKAVFEITKNSKDGFAPPVGVIREKYFDLIKTQQSLALPEKTERWTQPPAEWLELKKKLGLNL